MTWKRIAKYYFKYWNWNTNILHFEFVLDNLSNDLHPKCLVRASHPAEVDRKPVELKMIHVGDTKVRAKLRFEVVTARVIESGGKKHVVRALFLLML